MAETDLVQEKEIQLQRPLSPTKDNVDVENAEGVVTGPGGGLPFSKARCIALVLTVTGASFLNVGDLCATVSTHNSANCNINLILSDLGRSSGRHHPSYHRECAKYSGQPTAMDRLCI